MCLCHVVDGLTMKFRDAARLSTIALLDTGLRDSIFLAARDSIALLARDSVVQTRDRIVLVVRDMDVFADEVTKQHRCFSC